MDRSVDPLNTGQGPQTGILGMMGGIVPKKKLKAGKSTYKKTPGKKDKKKKKKKKKGLAFLISGEKEEKKSQTKTTETQPELQVRKF